MNHEHQIELIRALEKRVLRRKAKARFELNQN